MNYKDYITAIYLPAADTTVDMDLTKIVDLMEIEFEGLDQIKLHGANNCGNTQPTVNWSGAFKDFEYYEYSGLIAVKVRNKRVGAVISPKGMGVHRLKEFMITAYDLDEDTSVFVFKTDNNNGHYHTLACDALRKHILKVFTPGDFEVTIYNSFDHNVGGFTETSNDTMFHYDYNCPEFKVTPVDDSKRVYIIDDIRDFLIYKKFDSLNIRTLTDLENEVLTKFGISKNDHKDALTRFDAYRYYVGLHMKLLSGIGDNLVDIISDLTNSLSTVGLQDDYLIGPTAYQMYLQMMFAAIDWLLGL